MARASSQVKNFTTAVTKAEKEQSSSEPDVVKFQLNGEGPNTKDKQYTMVVPDETQIAVYTAAFAGETPDMSELMRSTLDLFEKNMHPLHYSSIRARLLNQADPVNIETLQEILEWVFEEAAAFPTQPSSDSTSGQQSTGPSSTDTSPPAESIPSGSRRTGSRTSSTPNSRPR